MKVLRLLLIVVALALGALAALLFARLSLAGALPVWLLDRFPFLSQYERWLPQDLITVAVAAALLAALCFGLAVPAWESAGPWRVRALAAAEPMGNLAFGLLLALAALLAVVLAAWTLLPAPPGWLHTAQWLGGMLLVLGTAAALQRERTLRVVDDESGHPARSWPLLLPVLLLAGLLFAWRGDWLPATLPPETIAAGLQAQAQSGLLRAGLIEAGPAGLPWLATVITALGVRFAPNPFSGLLWAGIAAGLALVAATWLLGIELFRRAPTDETPDDGRRPALLAALAVAVLMPTLHFARLPTLLAPVVWGVLGLWLLLRAVRTGGYPAAAGAGVLTGLALVVRPAGLIFAGAALATWLGLALTRRRRLRADAGGVGLRGFALWLAAWVVAAAPAFCLWGCGSAGIWAVWGRGLAQWGPGLVQALAALNITLQPISALPLVVLPLLLSALFLPALGGLIFHADQPIGWLLLAWLLLALAAAAPLSVQAVAWGPLVALLPACALALAFALDRVRAALARSLGGWVMPATFTLSAGLLLLAALLNWRDYPARLGIHPDAATALGRSVAQLAPTGAPLALFVAATGPAWDDPALRFARGGDAAPPPALPAISLADPGAWPATLPAGTHLLLPVPLAADAQQQIVQRYPGGAWQTVRDAHANPALLIYTLP